MNLSVPLWLQRFADRFSAADLTDRAAALTYYGFLSLFPALIIGVALIGVFGTYPDTYNEIVATLRDTAPGPVVDLVESALDSAVSNRGGVGGLLGVGLIISFYSASGATGAAVRAIEAAYGEDLDSAWWHAYVIRLALTIALALMFLIAFAAILLAGPLFDWLAEHAGISESVSSLVSLVRWPIGLTALLSATLLLYWTGSGRVKRLRQLLPGALVAMVVTLIATFGFNLYVANFNTYGATYGSLGAVIVLLVWMWLNSLAMVTGAALNAELEHPGGASKGEGAAEQPRDPSDLRSSDAGDDDVE